jgi:hypothetical protein
VIVSRGSVSRVDEIVGAFLGREAVEECADALPGSLYGTFGGLSQEGLELGEDLLDGIEVGRIRRQEEELCAGGGESGADGLAFVAAEIVHDDDVASDLPLNYHPVAIRVSAVDTPFGAG